MSLLNYDEIPGYAEAVNREQANRDLAFMPSPLPICGVPIRHLTVRHFVLLLGCRNHFITGGRIGPADVVGLLWFLSPEYATTAGAREKWAKKYAKVWAKKFVALVEEIAAYKERVFQDSPGGGGNPKLFTSEAAGIVDILASEYGWTDEAILEMPLARVFQYYRRIEMRHNPRKPQFNRSEKFIGEWLDRRMKAPATTEQN